jgi:DNA-binding response OmpR family regulator
MSAPLNLEAIVPIKRVLVIEDDATLREFYAEILAEEGYQATIWSSVPAALHAVSSVAPDLIVLDLILDQISNSGLTFLGQLKSEPDTAAIPVLVCTARVRFDIAEQAQLSAWVRRVMVKPFDLDDLLTGIRECLRHRPDGDVGRLVQMERPPSNRQYLLPPPNRSFDISHALSERPTVSTFTTRILRSGARTLLSATGSRCRAADDCTDGYDNPRTDPDRMASIAQSDLTERIFDHV